MEDIITTAILTILWGLVIGVLVSAPMGPTGILVIQRTLNKGWVPGLFTGLGAVFSDLFYAVLSTFAVSLVVGWIESNQTLLLFTAGVLIAGYGVFLWTSNPASSLNTKDKGKIAPAEFRTVGKLLPNWNFLKYFFSGFGLTVSNPAIVFFFLMLFSRAGFIFVAADENWGFYLLFFASIALGAIAWWTLITWIINKVRYHFKIRTLKFINRSIAVIMFIIALWGVGNGLWQIVNRNQPNTDTQTITIHSGLLHHARLLQMQELDSGRITLCQLINPWDSTSVAMQYLLVPASDVSFSTELFQQITSQYGPAQLIRTPLLRNTLTTAPHAWLLQQINALSNIAVLCDTAYIIDTTLKQSVRIQNIADGGSGIKPNIEVLLKNRTDAFWYSPYEQINTSSLPLSLQNSTAMICCADYLENTPLGRAEWMRFYGRLVGHANEADSLFQLTEARYTSIAHQAAEQWADTIHPMLLPEIPYAGVWYIPGGQSTAAQLYRDAQFNYPWSHDTHAGSLPLSPEAIFTQCKESDFWLFKNNSSQSPTLRELISSHPFYEQIKAVRQEQVYYCNTCQTPFFDITPFRPDLHLQDLIYISQGNTDSLIFYHRLR